MIPPWMDMKTLCRSICVDENTVDAWVQQGILPPPRKHGGKPMWKWSEVDERLTNGQPDQVDPLAEGIPNATRRVIQGSPR